jgi:hypothetical protein
MSSHKTLLPALSALVLAATVAGGAKADEDAKLVQTKSGFGPFVIEGHDHRSRTRQPLGVSHLPTSPFWVSNQGKSTAILYAVTDETNVTKININPPAGFVKIPTTASGAARTDRPSQQ